MIIMQIADCNKMKEIVKRMPPEILTLQNKFLKRRQIYALRDPEIVKQTLSKRRQTYWKNIDPAKVAQELSRRQQIYANKNYDVVEQALLKKTKVCK